MGGCQKGERRDKDGQVEGPKNQGFGKIQKSMTVARPPGVVVGGGGSEQNPRNPRKETETRGTFFGGGEGGWFELVNPPRKKLAWMPEARVVGKKAIKAT